MAQQPRRARELGIPLGTLPTGRHNAITDIPGVRVGQVTLVRGEDIRTGVTAIVPDHLAAWRTLPAALAVGNGYGKLVGSTQLTELGQIETPIVLTNTLSVFRAANALVTYMLEQPRWESARSVNPLVGEVNDGYLSDIRARAVTEDDVLAALRDAVGGPVAEGAVGAGTGTGALGFKAGIGTSSRRLGSGATLGALVQANFSGLLRVAGVPVPPDPAPAADPEPGNSCVMVLATDARLDARQLGRVARRAIFAMGTVGSDFAGGSGDYAIAFATARPDEPVLPEADLDAFFAASAEAVPEAILNSLFMAETCAGRDGHIRHAVPHDRVLRLLREHGMSG